MPPGLNWQTWVGAGQRNLESAQPVMSKNFEVASKPVREEAGVDECTGQVHRARFQRGFTEDVQELWLQAHACTDTNGYSPFPNYDLVVVGVGDLLKGRVWEELHIPGSRLLSIQMLSPKSVESTLLAPDKQEAPKPFGSAKELRMVMAILDTAILRVIPWNWAFKTLHLCLLSSDLEPLNCREKCQEWRF